MRSFLLLLVSALLCATAPSQVLQYAELNTTQVEHLDRAHTVVVITNGILEEHGPYLPSFADGYWDQVIAKSLVDSIAARPGWVALMLPTIPLGTNPGNVVGLRWSYPGSLPIRQSTMRAIFMDLADSLGEQGFRYVMIVDSHGGPTNSIALDAASDYFHDTYHGEMVHLLGLMPIFECCKAMEQLLTPKQLQENGMSIHGDALEHSQGLYARPDLVPPSYKQAPLLAGSDFAELKKIAAKPDWPGYLGAPSFASPELGTRFFQQESDAVNKMAADVLDGKVDTLKLPRYGAIMFSQTTLVEKPMLAHEAKVEQQHRAWLKAHPQPE